jgi:hypothetical protein
MDKKERVAFLERTATFAVSSQNLADLRAHGSDIDVRISI